SICRFVIETHVHGSAKVRREVRQELVQLPAVLLLHQREGVGLPSRRVLFQRSDAIAQTKESHSRSIPSGCTKDRNTSGFVSSRTPGQTSHVRRRYFG